MSIVYSVPFATETTANKKTVVVAADYLRAKTKYPVA